MSSKRSPSEQLNALYDELIDAMLEADEATLDALLRAEGRDPRTVAAAVRGACVEAAHEARTRTRAPRGPSGRARCYLSARSRTPATAE